MWAQNTNLDQSLRLDVPPQNTFGSKIAPQWSEAAFGSTDKNKRFRWFNLMARPLLSEIQGKFSPRAEKRASGIGTWRRKSAAWLTKN
jgi:hypothetical protein